MDSDNRPDTANRHEDCRICAVVVNPLPHARVPNIDWAANNALALGDPRLDRDENLPDERDAQP